jgi:transposase-like protein
MNPQRQCCHNPPCPARGPRGRGTSHVHSRVEQRSRCTSYGQTFATTKDTPFDRWRTASEVVTRILTLLRPGCPTQAMVAAFGVAARPVAAWLTRAGPHCQRGHQHVVQQGRVDLQHVQADELWGQRVGRRVWMGMAIAVPARLWLGGVSSPRRDLGLSTPRGHMRRACARRLAILGCVEGWASEVTAFLRVVRHPVRTGRRGRPRRVLAPGLSLGQVVKRSVQRRVVRVEPRVVRGTAAAMAAVLAATPSGTAIPTADIERLNATFRMALTALGRRGRAIAHTEAALTAGLWLVGCGDNCCGLHHSLRLPTPPGAPWQWQERTPAMAAGLTHHRWTRLERLRDQGPLPAWVAPKRRGRPPKRVLQPAMAVAA